MIRVTAEPLVGKFETVCVTADDYMWLK